jgi:hypothetical protein
MTGRRAQHGRAGALSGKVSDDVGGKDAARAVSQRLPNRRLARSNEERWAEVFCIIAFERAARVDLVAADGL